MSGDAQRENGAVVTGYGHQRNKNIFGDGHQNGHGNQNNDGHQNGDSHRNGDGHSGGER